MTKKVQPHVLRLRGSQNAVSRFAQDDKIFGCGEEDKQPQQRTQRAQRWSYAEGAEERATRGAGDKAEGCGCLRMPVVLERVITWLRWVVTDFALEEYNSCAWNY